MKKILIILFTVVIIGILGALFYTYALPKFNKENQSIERWISTNNLNEFGDPKNTAYSSGKPSLSPSERYDYIKKLHPDKPWEK